ncbi:IS4 family transposase [Ktedonospora formicarum]|uniref:IS4 family transposase n=1 Tax=Ktedonospora formicarum TaxID=2778364 RepID=A0A8J3MWA8_9CHLR|nr:IS4 family transposase [Ktedonospora formicarum]
MKAASAMVRDASASLPKQQHAWKEVKALYRFLDEPDVTFAALMQPHWLQTHTEMQERPLILLIQDTTELDLTHRQKMSGLGQIGDKKGRGLLLQTVLAVVPESREVLGCAQQEPFVRVGAPRGETRAQRRKRPKETDVWTRMVTQVGSAAQRSCWIHVGDRGADFFDFFRTCHKSQVEFLVRATQERRIQQADEQIGYLLSESRARPWQAKRPFQLPASHGRKARQTELSLSFGPLTVLSPRNEPKALQEPINLWVVRVWEEDGLRPQGEEPLEWILLTSVPTHTLQQAWERASWYAHRWIVEDSHQCLKTGCRIEERQVQSAERLMRVLGLLSPMAVRLLQLRSLSRQEPERLAAEVIEPELLEVVAACSQQEASLMALGTFWTEVARLGGFLARRSDGSPGWKTLWKGWLHVQTLLEGVHLSLHLRL